MNFNDCIEKACNYYMEKKIAFIENVSGSFQPTGGSKKTSWSYYYGVLKDGSEIAFLTKHTEDKKIDPCIVTKMQRFIMDRLERYGVQCFVILSLSMKKFYRVPWTVFKNMQELFCHNFMDEHDLEAYRLKVFCYGIMILEGVSYKSTIKNNNN